MSIEKKYEERQMFHATEFYIYDFWNSFSKFLDIYTKLDVGRVGCSTEELRL